MKTQWTLLVGLIFAIIIAVFAVINVDQVQVNYVFGEAHWPLILVILGSAFLGAVISISFMAFNSFRMNRQISHLQKEAQQKEEEAAQLSNEVQLKNAEITNLTNALAEKDEEITQLSSSVQQKYNEIQQLRLQLVTDTEPPTLGESNLEIE